MKRVQKNLFEFQFAFGFEVNYGLATGRAPTRSGGSSWKDSFRCRIVNGRWKCVSLSYHFFLESLYLHTVQFIEICLLSFYLGRFYDSIDDNEWIF